ncbi:MAG: DUF1343 domain-containing protein, partial [Acidobacteria bacterium]|nr:DUF1343 domain-containing protein [Acidobacteriota bacterium]
TPQTALLYPGGCLIEGTELSEGRGTTRPFHLVGAPHLRPTELAERLRERKLPGVSFVPTFFRPQFQKHAGAVCSGVELLVGNPETFEPYRTGAEILRAARACSPERFLWREKAYEFVEEIPAIDLLTGDGTYRRLLEGAGSLESFDRWLSSCRREAAAFQERSRRFQLYGD